MANTVLTIDMITREALRILHQKLNLVGNLNRQYDSSYANEGAKIGNTLRVRKPAKYTVRTGATLSTQDHTETKVDLSLATQTGVDVNFTTEELTMELDDFSKRVLDPAVAVIAAKIESTVGDGLADAAENTVAIPTTAVDFADINKARELLTYNLAPQDNLRCGVMNPGHISGFLNDTKGLFQESSQIANQYREGALGRIAGFDMFENTLIPAHTTGSVRTGTPLTNGSLQDGATIVTDGWTDETVNLKKGDVVTFATVNACHPETKADLGFLKQFVVTADTEATTAGALSIPVAPSVVSSGAYQNTIVVGSSTGGVPDGKAVVVYGTDNTTYQRSLFFHRDFAAFVTADLIMPKGVDMASRQVMDGISMRIVRDYDINNDKMPCRIDVLWGYGTLYPELGCTIQF
jgi:hypothetical protein